ncbi:MAG: serine hydrolase domain-containing protein [Pseudomonadota bacterium]
MKELKALISDAHKNKIFSAIAIEVYKKDNNILSVYEGTPLFDSSEKKQPEITEEYLFDLASLTKPLCTAVLCSLLFEKNILSLDTKISEIYDEYAISFNKELSDITMAQLLNHSSGLEAWFPIYKVSKSRSDAYMFLRSRGLSYKPGTKHVYSDLGYILLGEILEIVADKKLDYLFEHIIGPLELKRIKYLPTNERIVSTGYSDIRKKQLTGEVNDENCFALGGISGHAGLFGTAKHTSLTAIHVFNEHKMLFEKSSDGSEWAYGWHYPTPKNSSSGTLFSKNSVGITGFTGTSIWIDMEKDILVTILSNRSISPDSIKFGGETDKFTTLRPKLHDAIMGEILK